MIESQCELCDYCGKNFKSKNSFREHLKIHENVNFQCKEFFKSFPSKLLVHKNAVHESKPEYEICLKTFSNNSNLVKHLHDVMSVYCDDCDKQQFVQHLIKL